MIPGGIGYEVLKFEQTNLRMIADLPSDVFILQAMPDLAERNAIAPREWSHGAAVRPVYILIAHRYCVRVQPGATYTVTTMAEFLRRYRELEVSEREPLPEDGELYWGRNAWWRDEKGELKEYLWTQNSGWVTK